MPLRIGSRRSVLARWQAGEVQRRLAAIGAPAAIVLIETSGDRHAGLLLADIGGKGLFTQELENALRAGEIDLAVHSLKDVPTRPAEGLELAAMLEREDPRDALVAAPGATLASLASASRVGTSSLRRQAQGLALRPDLRFEPLRGNVDTRLRRWREGRCEALLLAAAGLRRLGLESAIAQVLPPDQFCPAAGQGVLVLQCRAGDAATLALLRQLDHAPTTRAARAERAVLAKLECGCQAPVGAYARAHAAGGMHLGAVVASADGVRLLRREADAQPGQSPEALGEHVADVLLRDGAAEILRRPDI